MSKDPWRDVAVIEEATPGSHGGRAWMLTLECGHLAFRKQQRCDSLADIARVMVTVRSWESMTAPRRVRCIHCGLGTAPMPAVLHAALERVRIATLNERDSP